MLGLKLLGSVERVVDERKAGALGKEGRGGQRVRAAKRDARLQKKGSGCGQAAGPRGAAHLAATKGRLEAKAEDQVGGGLVRRGELLADVLLGQVGESRVDHIDHLRGEGKNGEEG